METGGVDGGLRGGGLSANPESSSPSWVFHKE